MPDRLPFLVKVVDPYLGGALIVYGLSYVFLGAIWLSTEVHAWRAGLAWTRGLITEPMIAWAWIITGLFAVVAGGLSRSHRLLESLGFAAVVLTPASLGAWFVTAYVLTSADEALRWAAVWGILAVWSGWTGSRGDDRHEVVKVS